MKTCAPDLLSRKHPLDRILLFSLLIACASFTGCTFLPSSGPSGYRIRTEAGRTSKNGVNYQLLAIDSRTIDALRRFAPQPNHMAAGGRDVMQLFRNSGIEALGQGNSQSIRPGDVLNVTIFEAGGGLFKPVAVDGQSGGTPVTQLPPQPIDQTGQITIPYAGSVRVLGRLPGEVEKQIVGILKGKTLDPQVIVTISDRTGGDLVTVGGDVRTPRQVPVLLAGTRLLDAITAAGGPSTRPHEVMVSVSRGGKTRSDTFQAILDHPQKNILLQPADTVLLRNIPMNYMVFGAGGTVGSIPLETEDLNLAQAMARSGGANDLRANPAAVFIYRQENRKVVEAVLDPQKTPPGGDTIPVIYRIQLQNPDSFFHASQFNIRDRDILYYANATSVGVGKFMGLLNTLLSPVSSVAGGASTVRILAPGTFQ